MVVVVAPAAVVIPVANIAANPRGRPELGEQQCPPEHSVWQWSWSPLALQQFDGD